MWNENEIEKENKMITVVFSGKIMIIHRSSNQLHQSMAIHMYFGNWKKNSNFFHRKKQQFNNMHDFNEFVFLCKKNIPQKWFMWKLNKKISDD